MTELSFYVEFYAEQVLDGHFLVFSLDKTRDAVAQLVDPDVAVFTLGVDPVLTVLDDDARSFVDADASGVLGAVIVVGVIVAVVVHLWATAMSVVVATRRSTRFGVVVVC